MVAALTRICLKIRYKLNSPLLNSTGKTFIVIGILAVVGCRAPKKGTSLSSSGLDRIQVPERWQSMESGVDQDIYSGWLKDFNDERLIELVDEGLSNNPLIKLNEAQLRSIQDSIIITKSAQLPRVSSSMGGSYAGGTGRKPGGGYTGWNFNDNYSGGVNVSWELDVWGKLRNREEAAILDYEAAVANYRGTRLSLAANIARSYCNLITARSALELSITTLDIFRSNLSITERNYIAGDPTATALSVQLARNNVASAERSVTIRELAVNDASRALEIFLGRYPGADLELPDQLPALIPEVPYGLPSDLLMRRPDLVAASARLESATQRRIIAQKNLLPSVNLSGGGSARDNNLADLLSGPQSIAANVAASLSQPLYQGGSLRAQVRQAKESELISIETFANVALNAFREVESAIDREQSLAIQEESLKTELAQAELAEEQASRDYSEGLVNILSVLEAQRRAFSARNSEINLRNSRIQNRITLHLALGGDFNLSNNQFSISNSEIKSANQ